MKQLRPLAVAVKRKLAIRFGLAFILVVFFGLSSIRFYMDRTLAYNRVLMMEDVISPVSFSNIQLDYIADHISTLEGRMLKELIISNIIVVVVFTFFSYLLARGLFESLADSVEHEKRFLDDASHELRTPLAAITSISETTLRSSNNSTDDYKSALSEIFEESKRLSATINDLLFMSKSDDQRIKINMEKRDLVKIIASVSKGMQVVADQKSIKIETSTPNKEVNAMVDSDKIKQLLTILIDNAIKYSQNNSQVLIKLEDKPKVKISVKDFGQGISSKDLPHIFERFYRADNSRTDSGSGLGLSIAKWIAEAHKIKISVRSQLGKGSNFNLTF